MTLGKEIKVVLSLDDAGFSVKSKGARDTVRTLELGLNDLAQSVGRMETAIGTLGGNLNQFSGAFAALERSVKASAGQMQRATSESLNRINRAQQESSKVAQDSASAQIEARRRSLQAELASNAELLADRGRLHAQLRKLDSEQQARAMAASLAAEKAQRGKQAGAREIINANLLEARRLEQNSQIIRQEIQAIENWIATTRQAQATRLASIATLEAERVAAQAAARAQSTLAQFTRDAARQSAQELARQAKASQALQQEADRESLAQRRRVARELVDTNRRMEAELREQARVTANEQRRLMLDTAQEQRRQAAQLTQMWKAMAQTWSAIRIERGLSASVDQANAMQKERVLVQALNLPVAEQAQLFASSEAMAKNLQFLSTLEAIQSRMSAIASIGYNNAAIIDHTLSSAVKAANNLTTLGLTHGDLQATIRNLYGVVEMRQQTHDVLATRNTFDVMQRIITGTAGKVQTQDMETLLRRMGIGASQLSDHGLVNLAAVADQFKVVGGDGGAGGGVSTVGTAFKMMQAYALGKGLSNEAVKQFAGADILHTDGIRFSQDQAGVLKDAKHGGFKDAELWLKDPVAAIQGIMPKIVAYTQQARQRAQFYGSSDPTRPDNQMVAVSKYLQRLGITQTAATAMMVAGDPRSKHRIDKQVETIEHAKGIDGVDADLQQTYARNLQETKKLLAELGVLVGNQLLPPLNSALHVIKDILGATREFAQNNPMALQLGVIAVAAGGVVLAFKGFTGMFGLVGSLVSVLGSLGGATVASSGRVTAAMVNWTYFKVVIGEWAASIGAAILRVPVLGTALEAIGAGIGAIALRFGVAGAAASSVFGTAAKGLLRVAALVGWAVIAWDIGQIIGNWLKDVKVGSLTISDHVTNMLTTVEVGWKSTLLNLQAGWIHFLQFIRVNNASETAAALGQNAAAKAHLEAYRKVMTIQASSDPAPRAVAKPPPPPEHMPGFALAGSQVLTPAQQSVIDAAEAGGRRDRHGDPLSRALAEAQGKVNEQAEKLRALVAGSETLVSLREQAQALIEGKRRADDFSRDHQPQNRPALDNPQILALKAATYQEMLLAEQVKAVTFANERLAASTLEADTAMERISSGNAEKMTDAFRALSRELARAEERLGAGATAFGIWAQRKQQALLGQARADANNLSANYRDKNPVDATSLIANDKERTRAELAQAARLEDQKVALHLATLDKTRQASIAALLAEGPPTLAMSEQITRIEAEALASREALEQAYAQRRKIRAEQDARALESPLLKMTRGWRDTVKAVEEIEANAANGFVSMLTNALGTGRLEIGQFLRAILLDIANAKIKEALSKPFESFASSAGSWLASLFGSGGGSSGGSDMDYAGAIGSFVSTMFADGGVMTQSGPLALRKYASGGIANSAQVAIYGEAGPEAYVPLPDGRSIPVTLKLPQAAPAPGGVTSMAATAPVITVNVINQSSQPMTAEAGATRFDGKAYILDVVMTAVNTPGGFRQGLKQALK